MRGAGGLETREEARGQLGKFLGAPGRGRGRRPGACDSGCVSPGVCVSRDSGALAWNVPGGPVRRLCGRGRLPKIPVWERAAGALQRGERAGSGFVWFQKCTLLTARSPPSRTVAERDRGPPSDSWRWGPRAGLRRRGLGSPREFPFPLEQRKVCLRGICHSRAGQGCGARGAGDAKKVCARRDPGARRRAAGRLAGAVRVPDAGGRPTWSLGAELGGRRGGWSPAPSFPLPLRAEFGAQSRARTLRRPRAPRVSLRGVPGKGLRTKLFPVPEWTREFSFLQSSPQFPSAGWRAGRGAVARTVTLVGDS